MGEVKKDMNGYVCVLFLLAQLLIALHFPYRITVTHGCRVCSYKTGGEGGFLQVERLRTVHKVQQIQGGSNMTGTNCDLLTHK